LYIPERGPIIAAMDEPGIVGPGDKPRGILDFRAALRRFELRRFPPQGRLAPWLEGYWQVSWNLAADEEHVQSNISHASVNIAFEADGTWLYGVPDRLFTRRLSGSGSVLGIKFLPGGFFPFAREDLSRLRGVRVPLTEHWDGINPLLHEELLAEPDPARRIALASALLAARLPAGPARATETARRMEADPAAYTVARAAAELGLGARALEKLFRAEVGISPKEVIRRFRLQSAADRLAREPSLACGDLALELGYADQAHFIKDFKSVVGRPPQAYRREQ
jgi:AraC-like DNA-binding protein